MKIYRAKQEFYLSAIENVSKRVMQLGYIQKGEYVYVYEQVQKIVVTQLKMEFFMTIHQSILDTLFDLVGTLPEETDTGRQIYGGGSGAGTSGYSGLSGASGKSGVSGYSGATGQSGYSGMAGQSGYSGISGYSGTSGYSGSSATAKFVNVTQVGHGLVVGDWVYVDTADGNRKLAKADSILTSEVEGVVVSVSGNDFQVQTAGVCDTVGAVPALPVTGSVLYLSSSVAGTVETNPPSTINLGYIDKPVAIVNIQNNTMTLISIRGISVNNDQTLLAGANTISAKTNLVAFNNIGLGARADATLPNAQAGLEYKFILYNANGIRIIAPAGHTIKLGLLDTVVAGHITSVTTNSSVTLRSSGNNDWTSVAAIGDWLVDD